MLKKNYLSSAIEYQSTGGHLHPCPQLPDEFNIAILICH
jgi:hypothetical protein